MMKLTLAAAAAMAMLIGCNNGGDAQTQPIMEKPEPCDCIFPTGRRYAAILVRKGILGNLGFKCSDTLSRDSALQRSKFGFCDVYRRSKSITFRRWSDTLIAFGEDAAMSDKFDAVWFWKFPLVKHWGFSGAKPLRFGSVKNGWFLRLFMQSRLNQSGATTPFLVLSIWAKNESIKYRMTKLRVGDYTGPYPWDKKSDSVVYEDSGASGTDIGHEYEEVGHLPEFDVPVISLGFDSRLPPCGMNGNIFFGNGVLIELMTDSSWLMTKGLLNRSVNIGCPYGILFKRTFRSRLSRMIPIFGIGR